MKQASRPPQWQRRARPLLGTLVEIGLDATIPDAAACFAAAFAAVLEVQRCLSRFDPDSDVSRFHALRCGQAVRVRPASGAVLKAAGELQRASGGAFDVSLGTALQGWHCEGDTLHKLSPAVHLDLGGIGKGHAVDCAVQALIDHGCAAGWVNAGGDLRAFGAIDVPVQIRDEAAGGVRPFAMVRDGAFATSHFDAGTRSQVAVGAGARPVNAHVSVAAPLCLWADALTKVVALSGNTADPALARYRAQAWKH